MAMGRVKGFWRHVENGCIYAVESTTFGEVLGAAGPLDPENLLDLSEYTYTERINVWLNKVISENKLHRINPKPLTKTSP